MVRKCKICKEIISLITIKKESYNNKKRWNARYKDYTICVSSGYCIKCLRQQKTKPIMERLGLKKPLEFKSKIELKEHFTKKGYTTEAINTELGKYKGLL